MADSRTVKVEILGESKGLQGAFGAAEKAAGGFGSAIGAVAKVGVAAVGGLGLAAAGFATSSLTAFSDFQSHMNEVFSLIPDAGQGMYKQLTSQTEEFSKKFGVLPEQVIPALYQSLSAGVPPGNVFDFLTVAQQAAKGGVTDLTTSVNGLSSVVNAYGADTLSASQASDLMFTAVKDGKTTFSELSDSLFNVTPIASSLGVKFGDVTAAIAAMTSQGVPTSVATTQMRQAMVELSTSGGKAATTFESLSGKSFRDFIAGGGNIQSALQLMEKHANSTGVGLNDLFGSVEAGSAALALTGKGTAAFSKDLADMGNSTGATQVAFDQMDQGIGASVAKIKATIDVLRIQAGEKLAPAFLWVTNVVLTQVLPGVGRLASYLSGPLTAGFHAVMAVVLAFVARGEALAATLRGPLLHAFGLVQDGITTFRQALSGNWTNNDKVLLFHRILGNLGLLIRSVVMPAWNLLTTALGFVRRNFDGIMAVVRPLMTIMGGPLKTVLMGMLRGFGKDGLAGILPGAIQGLKDFGQAFLSLGKTALDALGKVDWAGVGKTILSGIGGALSGASDIAKGVDWGGVASTIMGALGTALSKASGIASSLLGSISGALGGADWGGVAGTIWGGIVAGFGVLSNAGGDLLSWLFGVVGGVDWSGLAGSIWSGIVAGFVALTTAGADLLGWLTSIVTGTDWSGLAGSIWSGVVTGFFAVADAATSLYTWLSGLVTGTDWSGFAVSLWGGIVTGFYAVTDAGAQFVAWLQSTLSGVDWSGIAGTISTGITGALSAIQSGGQSLDILGMIGLSPEKIQGVLDSLKPFTDFLSGQFTAILDNLKTSVAGVGDAFKGIDLSQVLPALKTLGEVLAGVLGVAIAGIVIQWRVFSEVLAVVLPAAAQLLVGSINAIAIVINTLAAVIGDIVNLVDDLIHGRWSAAWDDAKSIVSDLVDGITAYLQNLWTVVSGIFGGLISDILGKLGQWSSDAQTKMQELSDGMLAALQGLPSALGTLFRNAMDAALTEVKNLITLIPAYGSDIINGLIAGVMGVWSTITDTFGNIKGAVTGAFGNAGSWLYDIGSSIVGGLVAGIEAAAGAVLDAVQSIIDKIPKFIRDRLGISSPSRVMIPIGAAIPQGLAVGIDAGTPYAVAAAGRSSAAVYGAYGGGSASGSLSMSVAAATYAPSSSGGGIDHGELYRTIHRAITDAMGSAI